MDMSNYHIGGFVLLLGIIALGAFILWPSTSVAPVTGTTQNGTTVTDATGGPKQGTAGVSTTGAGTHTYEKGIYYITVYMTPRGFVPAKIEVTPRDVVRFINKDNLTMKIGSDEKTSSRDYSAVNQQNSVGLGGTFEYQVSTLGIWNYFNINSNPRIGGQVIVTQP